MSHLGWICSFWQWVVLCPLTDLGSHSGWPLHLVQLKLWVLIRIFVDLTEWTLNKTPHMFLCKLCDFIIFILTNNGSQKTHAGEREEKAPVRQVFPVSFVSFRIMFPLFLFVSALLHSWSILFLFHFSVPCLWCFPPYLTFPVSPPSFCFEEHCSSISAFVPTGLAQAQVAGETPGHCLDVWYCSASPQIALVRPWNFCQGTPVPLTPQGPAAASCIPWLHTLQCFLLQLKFLRGEFLTPACLLLLATFPICKRPCSFLCTCSLGGRARFRKRRSWLLPRT